MDGAKPRFADADLAQAAPALDDEEIISIGEPIWDVVAAQVIAPLTVRVTFEDSLVGNVRFESSALTGVLAKLADPDFFKQVCVDLGAVTWPGEIDFAPDAMHDEIARNGEWVLR